MVLLNLSNLPWVPKRLKRNQAIFHYLLGTGAFESGIYVQPPLVRNISTQQDWSLPYLSKIAEAEAEDFRVAIVQPAFTLPFTWRKPVTDASAGRIARSLQKTYIRDRPYLLWMNSIEPLSVAIAAKLAPHAATRIFDSSDDFLEFQEPGRTRDQLAAAQKQVLGLADGVLAVNQHLAQKLDHPNKVVFPNCTDFDNFQQLCQDWTLPPHFPKPQEARYIGFIGGLNRMRVDLDLLQLLFERLPQCQFLFVGYTNDNSIRDWLGKFPNADFIPEVAYDVLPTVIRSFDAAIVPHLDNENTRGNDLLKMLDYFACGVPVVTTRCSGVDKYAAACWIADSHEEFLARIEQLVNRSIPHNQEIGRAIARSRTWRTKVPELLPWATEAVPS